MKHGYIACNIYIYIIIVIIIIAQCVRNVRIRKVGSYWIALSIGTYFLVMICISPNKPIMFFLRVFFPLFFPICTMCVRKFVLWHHTHLINFLSFSNSSSCAFWKSNFKVFLIWTFVCMSEFYFTLLLSCLGSLLIRPQYLHKCIYIYAYLCYWVNKPLL